MKYVTETASAYVVRLPPSWKPVSFSFTKNQGKRLALSAAKKYIKENSVKCDDYKGYTQNKRKADGEVLGVYLEQRKVGDGNVADFWTANYQDDTFDPPKQRKKRFSIAKYGDQAESKAIEFRQEKMGKLKPTER